MMRLISPFLKSRRTNTPRGLLKIKGFRLHRHNRRPTAFMWTCVIKNHPHGTFAHFWLSNTQMKSGALSVKHQLCARILLECASIGFGLETKVACLIDCFRVQSRYPFQILFAQRSSGKWRKQRILSLRKPDQVIVCEHTSTFLLLKRRLTNTFAKPARS